MTTHGFYDDDIARKEDNKRKRRALAAGGLVLGLGAAVTLAAWTDDEFAFGDFNTGRFDMIGSELTPATAVGEYADHESTDGAELNFQLNATNMSPGQSVAAPFSVAQKADTTVDGRFWVASATATGNLAPYLSYEMEEVTAASDCTQDDPATAADETYTVGTSWNSHTFGASNTAYTGTSQRAAGQSDTDKDINAAFGNQVHLCIVVTVANDEAALSSIDNTTPTRIVWNFDGESGTTGT